MILKKVIATTTCFFVSAVLLSQAYSLVESRLSSPSIDTSAFTNLMANVEAISAPVETKTSNVEDKQITADIINVIDKELSKNIKATRYAVLPHINKAKKTVIAKVEMKKPLITNLSIDLTSYEIDNKELINLYAFEVEQIEYSTFEATKLASSYDEVKDEVAVKVASTENHESAPIEADEVKTVQPAPKKEVALAKEVVKEEVKEEADKADEELVMYDYSDKVTEAPSIKKDIDAKLYERPISNTVKRVIDREIGHAPVKKLVALNTQKEVQQKVDQEEKLTIEDKEIDLNSEENIVYDYSQEQQASPKNEAAAFASSEALTTQNTQYTLRAKELNLNTQKLTQLSGFEFIPDYDRNERISDSSTGEIGLGYSIVGGMNTQTGVIQGQGLIPTRIEVSLGSMKGLEVPLLNEEGIQKFLQKQGASVEGNLIMIAKNSNIIDTEIDTNYGIKFFFDKNFKQVQQISSASYILYAGVKTGNILLKYLLANKESAQKIIYVGDGEMYFEDPSFKSSERETFVLTTRNLLGQKKKELSISGDAISFFNTNNIAKKKALNAYELKIPTLVSGMRKYLEFKHLSDSIFVGTDEEKEIEVPGSDFIGKVLEVNRVNSLKDHCVVQINLAKDLVGMTANGKNLSGEMFVETSFLDKDGNFSHENADNADKAFVVGEMEGQINVKFDYTDGSSQFLKTFCSEGTYLVEQL